MEHRRALAEAAVMMMMMMMIKQCSYLLFVAKLRYLCQNSLIHASIDVKLEDWGSGSY